MSKKMLLGLTILVPVAALAAQTGFSAVVAQAPKTTICHHTASSAKPYTKLRLTKAMVKGHQRHAADIIPARSPCPTTRLSAETGGRAFTATLSGSTVLPGPGDADGTGTATIRLRLGEGRICYQLNVSQISLPATGAQIHLDPEAPAGSVSVTLTRPDSTGVATGCAVAARTLVAAILARPNDYYVNVRTADYANGAIRGQLTS